MEGGSSLTVRRPPMRRRYYGQPPTPDGTWPQSASEVKVIGEGSGPPPWDWLANARACEL